MASASKLKLAPITNLSDARFAAAAGIEYMGFCFDPGSPDFLLPIKAKEIIDWTTGSHTVGEFGDQQMEEILAMSELLNMDVVALNNRILPDEISQIDKPVIKIISLDEMGAVELANELCAYASCCDGFQLNGFQSIAGREDELKEVCAQYKIFWNLPYTPDTLPEIIREYKPYAIQLAAGAEEEVGIKDYDQLNEILDRLAKV